MSASPRRLRNFVNGEYVEAESDATSDVVSPVTAQVVATAPVSGAQDVDRAYAAAAAAFEVWGETTPSHRQQALLRFADAVEARADELVHLEAEKGFTLWSDNFVIPNLAEHKKNAERLINYYYDPKVMADVVAYVNYVAVVKGAQEIVEAADPSVADNPLIFPSAELLSRGQVFRGLTADEETRYNRKFQSVVTG